MDGRFAKVPYLPTDERSEEDGQRVERGGKQFLNPECENRRGFVAMDCEIPLWIEAESCRESISQNKHSYSAKYLKKMDGAFYAGDIVAYHL